MFRACVVALIPLTSVRGSVSSLDTLVMGRVCEQLMTLEQSQHRHYLCCFVFIMRT
jgi:hypothetical protein